MDPNFERSANDAAARCTACGRCYDVCPIVPVLDLPGTASAAVVQDLRQFTLGSTSSGLGVRWAEACNGSGTCNSVCPELIDVRNWLSIANLKQSELTKSEQERRGESTHAFRAMAQAVRLLATMQTSPGDLKRIIAPAAGRKADIVFYFGCNVLRSPHLVFNVMDILDAIDVEYEVLGGTAHCCGVVHYLKGDAEVYGRMAGQTKANLDRMSAAKVLAWCPTCQLQFNNAYKTLSGSDESMGHITGFLASQLHRISPLVKHSIPKRAVIHEHGGMEGVVEATRSLMQAIPGLELVDVPQNRDFGYQCSRVVQHPEAQAEVHRVMAENAEKAGVDVIITIYHGCHRQLCGAEGQYNFEVKNFTDMLAEALGLGRTDHYKGYRTSGSILQAIESAEVFLKQNGVSLNSDQVELLKREIFGELGLGPTVEAPAELTYST